MKKLLSLAIAALLILLCSCAEENDNTAVLDASYKEAMALFEAEKYDEAIVAFESLGSHKDSQNMTKESRYRYAEILEENGSTYDAAVMFAKTKGYQDAKARSFALWQTIAERETLCAGASFTVALRNDGTVVATGYAPAVQEVSSWTDIVAVSAGSSHSVALKSDGTVVASGANNYHECDVSSWQNIVAISAGEYHTVGLRYDGTVVATGLNRSGQCNVDDWKNIVSVSAGADHTAATVADGSVVATNQAEIGWSDIVQIRAAEGITYGLHSDGSVICTAEFENLTATAISAKYDNFVALLADGTVFVEGAYAYDPEAPAWSNSDKWDFSPWKNIVCVSAGEHHAVALLSDGTIVARGEDTGDECAVTDWTDIKLPN